MESRRSYSAETKLRVAVAGSGIIGLSIAWALSKRGAAVTIFDPNPMGRGASWAAAGMLAPAYEAAGATGVHPRLLEAASASKRLWRGFAAEMEPAAGRGLSFIGNGSFALARTAEDSARLDEIETALKDADIFCERMDLSELRKWEPGLGDGVREGLALGSDGQVDNRSLISSLVARVEASPLISTETASAPLGERGSRIEVDGHDAVVVAAGWQSPHLGVTGPQGQDRPLSSYVDGLSAIRPVRGQMLSLGRDYEPPQHTLRCGSLYIVPKPDRIVIGATSESGCTGAAVDASALRQLRTGAEALFPSLEHARQIEAWSGVRPGTQDHAPLIGATEIDGVYLACGHYRNGILLAPITAEWIASELIDGRRDPLAEAFSPSRLVAAPV